MPIFSRPLLRRRSWVLQGLGAGVLALILQAPATAAGPGAELEAVLSRLPLPPAVEPPTETALKAQMRANFPRGRSLYLARVRQEAERQGLPPEVADAVAHVESAYDPNAVGADGEVGLMQVLPSTALMLGFSGPLSRLHDPETNIRFGVTYLAQAWRLTGGRLCETLVKYRAGHGETRITPRSVTYCLRAKDHLATIGSPLANAPMPVAVASAEAAMPLPRLAARRGRVVRARPIVSRARWAEHERRIKAIEAKVTSASLTIMR